MSTDQCPECLSEIANRETECPRCGFPLIVDKSDKTRWLNAEEVAAKRLRRKRWHNRTIYSWVLLMVGLVIIGIGGVIENAMVLIAGFVWTGVSFIWTVIIALLRSHYGELGNTDFFPPSDMGH